MHSALSFKQEKNVPKSYHRTVVQWHSLTELGGLKSISYILRLMGEEHIKNNRSNNYFVLATDKNP